MLRSLVVVLKVMTELRVAMVLSVFNDITFLLAYKCGLSIWHGERGLSCRLFSFQWRLP